MIHAVMTYARLWLAFLTLVLAVFNLEAIAQQDDDASLSEQQQNIPTAEITPLWESHFETQFEGLPTVDGDHLYIGGMDGVLRKLDRLTGEVVWQKNVGAAIGSTVTVDREMIYFASWDGAMHARWKDSGDLVWVFKTEGEKQWDTWDHRLSTPTVDHERVYFGSGDHHIYGLNKRNGDLRWKYKTGGIIHSQPALDGEKVIVGSFDGYLYALDRANGQQVWAFKTVGNSYFRNGAISSSPLVHDGVVYFGSRDYNIYAVLSATGTGAWNYRTPSWVVAQPLIFDKTLYVTNSTDARLMAVNIETGYETWHSLLNINSYGRSVAVGEHFVASAAQDGRVYLIKRDGSGQAAFYDTPSARENRDAYFDGDKWRDVEYQSFRHYEQHHHSFLKEVGAINAGLVAHEGVIYLANSGGDIVALEVKERSSN